MKQCPQCREEFADKFGFCPVDGTPLDAPSAVAPDESVVTASAPAADPDATSYSSTSNGPDDSDATHGAGFVPPSNAGGEREELHLTFLEDEGLTRRLVKELKAVGHDAELTWPEFKRDPVGFTKRSASAYGSAGWKFISQRNVAVAIAAAFVIIGSVVGFVIAVESLRSKQLAGRNPYEDLEIVGYVDNEIPKEQPTPDKGPAGTNEGKGGGSKPKYDKPAGGGGGGRQDQTPASQGKLPTAQLEVPPILTASPKPPPPNPHLPTPVTMQVDPMLVKVDPRDIPYGLPNSTATVPPSGPGRGGGMGDGTGGG